MSEDHTNLILWRLDELRKGQEELRVSSEETHTAVTRMEVTVDRLNEMEPRVKSLEDSRERARGAAWISKTVIASAGGLAGAIISLAATVLFSNPKP